MIISHKYKFIFIKTHKTAGSSMEEALIPYCGPHDIITPMESNAASGRPRNFHSDDLLTRVYANSRWVRKLLPRNSNMLGAWYYEHMPAREIRNQVGAEIWDSYFKFCFERNPWEKVVSYYLWKRYGQGRNVPPFRDYVLKKTHRLPMDGQLYIENGMPVVDFVGRFENFEQDFLHVCERLGIPFDGNFPEEKIGIAPDRRPYYEFFCPQTRSVVAEKYADEIRLFNYRFGEEPHHLPAR